MVKILDGHSWQAGRNISIRNWKVFYNCSFRAKRSCPAPPSLSFTNLPSLFYYSTLSLSLSLVLYPLLRPFTSMYELCRRFDNACFMMFLKNTPGCCWINNNACLLYACLFVVLYRLPRSWSVSYKIVFIVHEIIYSTYLLSTKSYRGFQYSLTRNSRVKL